MVFITKSYQDLFGVRSYINALSFITLILFAVTAFAEPQLVSLSNKNGKTTVVFTLSSFVRRKICS